MVEGGKGVSWDIIREGGASMVPPWIMLLTEAKSFRKDQHWLESGMFGEHMTL